MSAGWGCGDSRALHREERLVGELGVNPVEELLDVLGRGDVHGLGRGLVCPQVLHAGHPSAPPEQRGVPSARRHFRAALVRTDVHHKVTDQVERVV